MTHDESEFANNDLFDYFFGLLNESRVAEIDEQYRRDAEFAAKIDLYRLFIFGHSQYETVRDEPIASSAEIEDEVRRYLELSDSELREELWEELFETEGELVRSAGHPFDQYLESIRRVVCQEWDWKRRRNDPAWNDPINLAIALVDAFTISSISLPFPAALTAVTVVRMGVDNFCKGE